MTDDENIDPNSAAGQKAPARAAAEKANIEEAVAAALNGDWRKAMRLRQGAGLARRR